MLNEFKEFEAYVINPESLTPRVQPLMLTDYFDEEGNYLIGIEEIMTVIARGFLFSKGHQLYGTDGQINEKLIEAAIELLHRWTGFSDTEYRIRTENPQLEKWMKSNSVKDSWLKKYWMFHFQNYEKKNNKKITKKALLEKTTKRWNKLEEKWNYSLNSPMDYAAVKITYKNVIANALEKGPLRNRYLVVKRSEEQVGKKFPKGESKPFSYLTDKSSRQGTSDMKILKVIAAYIINKESYPVGQNEIWIKSGDLSRWYAQDDAKKGLKSWYPENVTWKGVPVYTFKRLQRKYTKLFINQEYLKEYDFHIIEDSDMENYRNEHWILEDCGQGLKNCWYIK